MATPMKTNAVPITFLLISAGMFLDSCTDHYKSELESIRQETALILAESKALLAEKDADRDMLEEHFLPLQITVNSPNGKRTFHFREDQLGQASVNDRIYTFDLRTETLKSVMIRNGYKKWSLVEFYPNGKPMGWRQFSGTFQKGKQRGWDEAGNMTTHTIKTRIPLMRLFAHYITPRPADMTEFESEWFQTLHMEQQFTGSDVQRLASNKMELLSETKSGKSKNRVVRYKDRITTASVVLDPFLTPDRYAVSKYERYENGVLNGLAFEAYLVGNPKSVWKNLNGKRTGMWAEFHHDGMPKRLSEYSNGELVRIYGQWDGDGNRLE